MLETERDGSLAHRLGDTDRVLATKPRLVGQLQRGADRGTVPPAGNQHARFGETGIPRIDDCSALVRLGLVCGGWKTFQRQWPGVLDVIQANSTVVRRLAEVGEPVIA